MLSLPVLLTARQERTSRTDRVGAVLAVWTCEEHGEATFLPFQHDLISATSVSEARGLVGKDGRRQRV